MKFSRNSQASQTLCHVMMRSLPIHLSIRSVSLPGVTALDQILPIQPDHDCLYQTRKIRQPLKSHPLLTIHSLKFLPRTAQRISFIHQPCSRPRIPQKLPRPFSGLNLAQSAHYLTTISVRYRIFRPGGFRHGALISYDTNLLALSTTRNLGRVTRY